MKRLYFILLCLIIPSVLFSCAKTKNGALQANDSVQSEAQLDAREQFERGLMYYWGRGAEQDYGKAFKWLGKSAGQGYAEAQYVLGGMYYLGEGTEQDYVLAHFWFNQAAAQGNEKARKSRDTTAEKMSPAQLEKTHKLAKEYKTELDNNN